MRPIDAGYAMEAISRHRKPTPVGQYGAAYNDGINAAIQEILLAPTLTPPNEVLTCDGCYYLDRDPAPCAYCIRSKPEGDHYRRPPEGEA